MLENEVNEMQSVVRNTRRHSVPNTLNELEDVSDYIESSYASDIQLASSFNLDDTSVGHGTRVDQIRYIFGRSSVIFSLYLESIKERMDHAVATRSIESVVLNWFDYITSVLLFCDTVSDGNSAFEVKECHLLNLKIMLRYLMPRYLTELQCTFGVGIFESPATYMDNFIYIWEEGRENSDSIPLDFKNHMLTFFGVNVKAPRKF